MLDKDGLRQLLNEALGNLDIRRRNEDVRFPQNLTTSVYGNELRRHWYYGMNPLYEPHVINPEIYSKILKFIRAELSDYINGDYVYPACYVTGGLFKPQGYTVLDLIGQILRIAVGYGIEQSIHELNRVIEDDCGTFQFMAILDGIFFETEVEIDKHIRILPVTLDNVERLHPGLNAITRSVPSLIPHERFKGIVGRSLLIIDADVYPMFCKSPGIKHDSENHYQFVEDNIHPKFQIRVNNSMFPINEIGNMRIDYNNFCVSLSLACNSVAQISRQWVFLSLDQIFNLYLSGYNQIRGTTKFPNLADRVPSKIKTYPIQEVKNIYDNLLQFSDNSKLIVAVNRWQRSKVEYDLISKIVDLAISFESIYLSGSSGESSFRLAVYASRFLGKDKNEREEIYNKLRDMYDFRSKCVHTGEIPTKKLRKTKTEPKDFYNFIIEAQDLFFKSILKIIQDGKFPEWEDIIHN